MKIIFVFNLIEMQSIIFTLSRLLKEDGYEVMIYDFTSCKIYDPATEKTTFMKSFWWAPFVLKFRYIRSIFKPAINRRCIQQDFEKKTIVHFQHIKPLYVKYIKDIQKSGSKLVTTFWGSDYLKADSARKKLYEPLLEASSLLACTRIICQQLSTDFPAVVPKLRPVFFGIEFLKIINAVSETDKTDFKKKYHIPSGKIIITIGYNADDAQRHSSLISIINETDSTVKEKIHVLVPLTYGGTVAYRKKLSRQLRDAGLSFSLFEKKLPAEEVALLRCVSDIVLNIQETDAFSGTISESIEAGNIVIVGDWLPYAIYEEWGLFLVRIKREEFLSKLNEVLSNMEYWQSKAFANKGKVVEKVGWQATYPAWKALYTSLEKEL